MGIYSNKQYDRLKTSFHITKTLQFSLLAINKIYDPIGNTIKMNCFGVRTGVTGKG